MKKSERLEEIEKQIQEKNDRIEYLLHRKEKDVEYHNYDDAAKKQMEIELLEMETEKLYNEKNNL